MFALWVALTSSLKQPTSTQGVMLRYTMATQIHLGEQRVRNPQMHIKKEGVCV